MRGLKNVVRRVRVVGSGTELAFRKADAPDEVPDHMWIEAPDAKDLDAAATVIAIELEGELDLYTGSGRD